MPDIDPEASPSWRTTRARIARYRRTHPDGEVPAELRRDHAAARLEDHVRRVVDAAPPLTNEQRERISSALARPA